MTITIETKQLRAIAVEAKDVATSGAGSAPIFSNVLKRNADGTFEVKMVQPAEPAKLTNADKRLRDSVLLAQLEERARRGE